MGEEHGHVWQELACRKMGGGCGGFILMKFNLRLNRRVMVVCPNCKHEHERTIQDGKVMNDYHRGWKCEETFTPVKSFFSKTPRTEAMKLAHLRDSGNATVVTKEMEQQIRESGSFARQSWLEWAAGRLTGRE